jgi:hypothetical protein
VFLHRRSPALAVLGAAGAIAAAAVLAACSGSQSVPTPQGISQASSAAQTCITKGGVTATPCSVQLTAAAPGPVSVSVQTPKGSKGVVKEHDLCSALGIAAISGSDTSWTVTAGSAAGKCRATFAYFNNGQKVGYARIVITNSI